MPGALAPATSRTIAAPTSCRPSLVGALFVVTHLVLRIRRALASGPAYDLLRASRDAIGGRVVRLLPIMFAVQMLALYCMETAEQVTVVGHPLGGTIWLGGPVLASLAVHAATCALVAFAAAKLLRVLARSAVRGVLFILAMGRAPGARRLARRARTSLGLLLANLVLRSLQRRRTRSTAPNRLVFHYGW